VTARPGYERRGVTRELLVALALAMPVSPRAIGAHLWPRSLFVVTVADVGDIVPRPDMLSS
jgi:hypothetical protein